MVVFCPKCGTQAVDQQSRFCNACGSQLPPDTAEEPGRYCPNCTSIISDNNAARCPRCGFLLSPKSPSAQSVKLSKNCPECGSPVPDENRYYCNTCGAYIRNAGARKAALAIDPAGAKTIVKKPVIIPGVYQNTPSKTIAGPKTVSTKKTINLANPGVKMIGLVVVVLAVILVAVWGGLTLLGSGSPLQPVADELITQDLSSMSLTSTDLPSGWVSGNTGGTDDAYSAQFFSSSENSESLVEETITRFPGIEEARLELNSEREQVSGLPVETINLGNGGFGYIDANYVMVIFRRGNIIVKIEDTRTEYQENPTMNNAKNYAQIVAGRIR